jgi:3alpha(or 20beta)-hydroxysteroid dehydrogenase
MRAVVQTMPEAEGGSIVNVSSNAGIGHVPGIFSCATTKWAVRGMSKLAASELVARGIRVNVIFSGNHRYSDAKGLHSRKLGRIRRVLRC